MSTSRVLIVGSASSFLIPLELLRISESYNFDLSLVRGAAFRCRFLKNIIVECEKSL